KEAHQIALGGVLAAPNVDDVGSALEGNERNAERQDDADRRSLKGVPHRREQSDEAIDEEVEILEEGERHKGRADGQEQHDVADSLALGTRYPDRRQVVDQRESDQQRQEP